MTEVNPTPQDREALAQVYRQNAPTYAAQIIAGHLDEDDTPLMHAITTSRLQGRREALEEAARVAEECPIDLPLAPGLSCGAVAASRQIATAIRAIANKP